MSGRTLYTFAGVNFTRITADEVQPWLYAETQYTADPVLGGALVYVDIGGDTPAPLSFRASCSNSADRAALISARGTTGTLSNTRGHTGTVVLVKATPINANPYAQWLIDLTFVLVSS